MAELNPKQEVWLNADEMASHMRVTASTIRARCSRGVFPNAVKASYNGGPPSWRIPMSDLDVPDPPEGLTAPEAARLVGISSQWMNRMCLRGKLPAVFWQRKWYIRQEDLDVYVKERKNLHDIRYDILRDPDKLWKCYVDSGHSFRKAAIACDCSNSVLRDYFFKANLTPYKKTAPAKVEVSTPVDLGVYATMDKVPDQCPKHCRGWVADKDCLTEGMDCIFG